MCAVLPHRRRANNERALRTIAVTRLAILRQVPTSWARSITPPRRNNLRRRYQTVHGDDLFALGANNRGVAGAGVGDSVIPRVVLTSLCRKSQAMDHPHIVKLREVFDCQNHFYMIMELCTGGELFDRIVMKVKFTVPCN